MLQPASPIGHQAEQGSQLASAAGQPHRGHSSGQAPADASVLWDDDLQPWEDQGHASSPTEHAGSTPEAGSPPAGHHMTLATPSSPEATPAPGSWEAATATLAALVAAEQRAAAGEQAVLVLHSQLGQQQELLEKFAQRAAQAEQALAAAQEGSAACGGAWRVASLERELATARSQLRQVAAVAARVQHLEQKLASAKDEAAAQRARAARAEQAAERAARTVMQRKHEHGQVTAALEAQLRQVQEQAKRDALEAEQQYSSRVRGLGAEHSAAVLVQRAAS